MIDLVGTVTSVHKTGFNVLVRGEDTPRFCIINNSFAGTEKPVVGDAVVLKKEYDQHIITGVRPRRSFVARYDHFRGRLQGFAANVDTVFVVTSANREFSVQRVGRFLALAAGQGIRRVVVLTKTDLTDKTGLYEKKLRDAFGAENVDIISLNATDLFDTKKLLLYIPPEGTALLVGSSGVGKSTIINTLCGSNIKTNEVKAGKHMNKGKHTTSARSMYFLPEGRKIIDIPGVRVVGLPDEVYTERARYKH
jgi:ribosome biogenesis GTPase